MKNLLTVFILLFTFDTFAQTTIVIQDELPNSAPVYYFHQRKVARSTTGQLLAAWNNLNAAGGQIVYSIYDESFGIWSPPVAISSAGDRAIQAALAADELGNIHATWQQRNASSEKYQTYYSKYNGLTWSTPVQISVAASVRGEEATIEVSSNGTLWVVYNNDGEGNGSEYLFAVHSTDGGSNWSSDADTLSYVGTFGTSIEVGRTSLATAPDGKMVAIWDNSLDGVSTRREVFCNQYDGSKWLGEVRVSDTTTVDRDHNRYVASAVDKDGNIYVFYGLAVVSGADPRLSYLVMAKKGWSEEWSTNFNTILDSSTANYLSVSATIDSMDFLHVAYRRNIEADTVYGLSEIVYSFSRDKGLSWGPRVVMSRPDHDGGYVSLGNRVRAAYGVDMLWRESKDPNINDQDTTSVMYGNFPYNLIPIGVRDASQPTAYLLLKNYPNPFNPETNILYSIPQRDKVMLTIYDALGNEVVNLINNEIDTGDHAIVWNGRNDKNLKVTSGIYFAKLITSNQFKVIKMMLMK